MNWQDISSAPKDGSILILDTGLDKVIKAWWDSDSGLWSNSHGLLYIEPIGFIPYPSTTVTPVTEEALLALGFEYRPSYEEDERILRVFSKDGLFIRQDDDGWKASWEFGVSLESMEHLAEIASALRIELLSNPEQLEGSAEL